MNRYKILFAIIIILLLASPAYADTQPPRPTGYAEFAATKVSVQTTLIAEQHRKPTVTPTPIPWPTYTPAPYPEPYPVPEWKPPALWRWLVSWWWE